MPEEIDNVPAELEPPTDPVPEQVSSYAAKWWSETAETPEQHDFRLQYHADNHDLFPFDARRRLRNEVRPGGRSGVIEDNVGIRTRGDQRIVQNPHVFRASQRTVAMVTPHGQGFEYKPRKRVPSISQQEEPLTADPLDAQFAKTMQVLHEQSLEEIGWNRIVKAWGRNAAQYRAGILKTWFADNYFSDILSDHRMQDMQDDVAELESLWADYRRGEFDRTDGRFEQMISLQMAVQDRAQVDVWRGLCAEVVSPDRFAIDPRIRAYESFYSARWMREDFVMTRRDILARFPFAYDEEGRKDGSNPKGFVGVHPDHLSAHDATDIGDSTLLWNEKGRRDHEEGAERPRRRAYQDDIASEDEDDDLFLVRQIEIKSEGKVIVLIDGVDYPVWEWEPEIRPACWFSYHPLCYNTQDGHWFGRSDTELASDEQARLNSKQTDAEKMRDLVKPRGIFNSSAMDEAEANKLSQMEGGEYRGINVPGDSLRNNLMWEAIPYDPVWEDTSQNERMLEKMVGFSEQFLGNVGGAEFATEVRAAAQGANIMVADRQGVFLDAMVAVLTAQAEMLIQAYDESEVKLLCGENAYWPALYSRTQAKRMERELMLSVYAQVQMELEAVQADPQPEIKMQEFPGLENPAQRAKALYEEAAKAEWGALEPRTRESVFKRLRIEVQPHTSAKLERQQQMANVINFAGTVSELGVRVAPKAIASIMAELLDMRGDADDLITVDPNVAANDALVAIQESAGQMVPEAVQALATAGKMAQQILLQQAEQEGVAAAIGVANRAADQADVEEAEEAEEAEQMTAQEAERRPVDAQAQQGPLTP